ncbi:MAG: hypothetical protein H6R07_2706 [Proteobacteria bacterium]|nr:hypothetical protein [Pseudomonadota bacterium]
MRLYVRAHPYSALALLVSALCISWLFGTSSYTALSNFNQHSVEWGLIGGMAGFLATCCGALPALFLKKLTQRTEDTMLGMAAGMMLAASAFSLVIPGVAAGAQQTGSPLAGAVVVALGIGLGALLMLGLDQFTPHTHPHGEPCGPCNDRLNRVWLFVLAITLHNLPEGMAIGVSFSQADLQVGLPLTTAIAIQDIPEGLAVAMSLRAAGFGAFRAVLIAGASGFMEPLGALFGVGLSSGMALAYPIGLGLAAGAMIFVVSHEVIPETHRNGHQTPSTLGLMTGFVIMMILDTALG